MRAAIDQGLGTIQAPLPGKIDTYDEGTQKADVKPLLKRPLVDEDGNDLPFEVLPVIPSVPIVFPRADFQGAKFFMSFPLKPGDHVALIIMNWSLDAWKSLDAGTDVEPTQFRQHDLSDAVAIPGLYPFGAALSDAHPDNLVLGRDGGIQIHLKPSDEIHLGSENAADFVALAQKVLTELQAVETDLTTIKTTLSAHIHPTTTPGAQTGTPAPPGDLSLFTPNTPASVAADKVKAD